MSGTLTGVRYLRLTQDHSGEIWYSTNEGPPKASGMPIEEFQSHQAFQDADIVRILGSSQNASLIRHIHILRTEGHGPGQVQLGTPAICRTSEERNQPAVVLTKMRTLNRPASVGGWHEMRQPEYGTYALAAAWSEGAPREVLDQLLPLHPAYPAIAFLRGFEIISVAAILTHIMDPRWYVKPDRPSSSSLDSYLGLWPRHFISLLSPSPGDLDDYIQDRWIVRALAASSAWAGRTPQHDGDYHELTYNFLWRAFHGYEADGASEPIAWLKATKLFIRFLTEVWKDALSHQELFVPEYFFKYREDAVAYKTLLARLASKSKSATFDNNPVDR